MLLYDNDRQSNDSNFGMFLGYWSSELPKFSRQNCALFPLTKNYVDVFIFAACKIKGDASINDEINSFFSPISPDGSFCLFCLFKCFKRDFGYAMCGNVTMVNLPPEAKYI